MKDYLVVSGADPSAVQAVIVLPDVWGQTEYSFLTLKQFSEKLQCPCYILDYFYELTKTPSKFNPDTDEDKVFKLMETMHGEDFMSIFAVAISSIKAAQPQLKSLAVIGFCFGGRLAYLGGLIQEVNKVVSFYGAGAHTPNYYQDQTPIEALCAKRNGDSQLSILSFYGLQDGSIPDKDRTETKALLQKANIAYTAKEYEAGHAYFQPGRPNYNETAANSSWQELEKVLT